MRRSFIEFESKQVECCAFLDKIAEPENGGDLLGARNSSDSSARGG